MAASMSALSGTASSGTALEEVANGAFVRTATAFHDMVSADPDSKYPAEAGRYHLYVANACPWAHRTLMVRALKGLEGAIGVSIVHPTFQRTRPDDPDDDHCGWVFKSPGDPPVSNPRGFGAVACNDCVPDTVNHAKTVRELYDIAGYSGKKFTVPILWDTKTSTIVNNESSEIIRMLNGAFNAFAAHPALDLYPESLRPAIDALNGWVYDDVNNGVYKCGFAQSQEAYDGASAALFAGLERLEAILATQRYLVSDSTVTEADVRAFATLVRFDEVYVVYFKCNQKCVRDFPNLRNYCRELFQLPGIAATVNMRQIKEHYYTSHAHLNPFAVVPTGPKVISDLALPHDRATKEGSPAKKPRP